MTDVGFHIPVATLPEPVAKIVEQPNGGGTEDQTVIEQAALMVANFKREREQLQTSCTELTLTLAARKRDYEALLLERAELKNNLSALSAQCDELKQEASDLRAFFSSIRAQLDHFEIPLPIRKRVQRNGKPAK